MAAADADSSDLPELGGGVGSTEPQRHVIHSLLPFANAQPPASAESAKPAAATSGHAQILDKLVKGKNNDGKKTINGFYTERPLGEGAYATVDLVANSANPTEKFALKKMSKKQLQKVREYAVGPGGRPRMSNALEKVRREIAIMHQISHSNVIGMSKLVDDPNEDPLYLFLDYAPKGQIMTFDGDKRRYEKSVFPTNSAGGIAEESLKRVLCDLLDGLEYIHSLRIVHRDIKPENVLVDDSFRVKFADFGVARQFTSDEDGMLSDTQGTFHFFSPEMCSGAKYSGYMADVWALGITMFIFTYTTLPYISEENNAQELFDMISKAPVPYPPEGASKEWRNLLESILEKDPKKRFTIPQIRSHPWLADTVRSAAQKDSKAERKD